MSFPHTKTTPEKTDALLTWVTVVITGTVFALDVLTPLGVAVSILYVAPVLLSLWSPQQRYTLIVASASSAFTVLDIFLSPDGGIAWMAFANRALALFVIWVTAILVLRYKQQKEEAITLRGLLPMCASCKKIRDANGRWNHLEVYIETYESVEITHSMCDDCIVKWYPELNPEQTERFTNIRPENN
jgi:hypothetical protein